MSDRIIILLIGDDLAEQKRKGYYFTRPLPAAQFVAFVLEHNKRLATVAIKRSA